MVPLSACFLAAVLGQLWTSADGQAAKEEILPIDTLATKNYVLATPVRTHADGSFRSNVVSSSRLRRSRRDVSPSSRQLYFNVTAFGRDFHLRLHPNIRLIAPGAVVEWHEDSVDTGNSTESVKLGQTGGVVDRIWKKEPLWTDCAYVGDLVGVPGASVAVSNCDGLAGMIRTDEDEYFIEPLEKGKQMEEEGGRAHVVYKRSAMAQDPTNVPPTDFHSEAWDGYLLPPHGDHGGNPGSLWFLTINHNVLTIGFSSISSGFFGRT